MRSTASDKLRLSMAGEYGVCSELSKRGFDVSLTFGNAKAVDIFVHLGNGSFKRIDNENESHYYILTHEEMGNTQMIPNKMTVWTIINGCDNVKRSLVERFENRWEIIK